MELYLLKSAACLAILLAFYKLFLEKESFHNFKRFYLLIALFVSFSIPLLTFTYYVEVATSNFSSTVIEGASMSNAQVIEEEANIINWSAIIWTLYSLGVLFFGVRFLLNLSRIIRRIQSNPKTKRQSFINVLLNDLVIPHTFFNYIFLNKSKFEKHEIPEEVLLHEQTHAKQKHSIDILLIEIFQIVFWFNPLIYLLKNTVKLNHEFLADQAVMSQGVNLTTYQQLLLAFSSNAQEPQLANAINYSSIKKRFTVMKTQTSKNNFWIKSFILLPLLATMVYGFSTTKTIEKKVEPLMDIDSKNKHTARSIDLRILDNGNYLVNGIQASKNSLAATMNTLHKDITPEIRNTIMNIHVSSTKEITNDDVWFIYKTLWDYGFYRIVTPNQEIIRGKGNTPFKLSDIETKDSSAQKSASREQMAEYTKLAKHYNTMLKKKDFTIKMKHVERLKYIYGIMSEKQRQDAEPFPDFPKPPPAPEAPRASKHDVVPPPPPLPPNATPAQKVKYKEAMKVHNSSQIVPPPPAPAPTAPPTMEEMAKKGATFYMEGKRIPSDEAIKIVNKNKDINIQIRDVDSKQPTVKLSKKGITVKRLNPREQASINLETGNIKIKGENYFYATKNGITSYFNNKGQATDKYGNKLSSKSRKSPTFHYRGKQILSPTANKLLRRNAASVRISTTENLDGSYKIILTDTNNNSIKNYSSVNPNNANPNSGNNNLNLNNKNLNNNYDNPNSVIDLTEVISKGATFYYEDEKITTEKALLLTRSNSIERVQTIQEKDGKPKVYFWKKA